MHVTIYIGSAMAHANGAFSALIRYQGTKLHEKELTGELQGLSSYEIKMTAALEALKLLKKPCVVTIVVGTKYHRSVPGECPKLTAALADFAVANGHTVTYRPHDTDAESLLLFSRTIDMARAVLHL